MQISVRLFQDRGVPPERDHQPINSAVSDQGRGSPSLQDSRTANPTQAACIMRAKSAELDYFEPAPRPTSHSLQSTRLQPRAMTALVGHVGNCLCLEGSGARDSDGTSLCSLEKSLLAFGRTPSQFPLPPAGYYRYHRLSHQC